MKIKIILAIVAMFYFLFPNAFPEEITIDIKKNFTAFPGDLIMIPITLKNNINDTQQISISVCSEYVSWITIPNYFFILKPYEEKATFIYIEVPKDAKEGKYAFAIIAFPKDTQIKRAQKIFKIIVLKNETSTIRHIVYPKIEMASLTLAKNEILPGENVSLSIILKNLGNTTASIKIIVKTTYSCYGEKIFELRNYTTVLAENSSKSLLLALPVRDCCDAGNYSGKIEIFYNYLGNRWKTFKEINFSYRVKVVGNVKTQVKEKRFPIAEKIIEIANNKNTKTVFTYKIKLGRFHHFYRFDPKPSKTLREGDKHIYVWTFSLNRGDVAEIVMKSYIPLFLALLSLFVMATILLLYYSRKYAKILEINKKAKFVGREKDTRIIKVWIHIKNCRKETIRKVRLIEVLPKQVELIREFELLYPDISRENSAIILMWKIGNLRANEEIILSYTVKTKQNVVLSPTKVKFRFKAEDKEELSNRLRIVLRR